MHQKIKTLAFVLKKRLLLQSDYQVTLYSLDLGKIIVIAKGARSFKSRRAPHLQTGNLVNVIINNRGNFSYLEQSDLISAFSTIRTSICMGFLYQFLYALEGLMPQNEKDEDIFYLLKEYVLSLHRSGNNHEDGLSKYLSRLLNKLGYLSEDDKDINIIMKVEEILGRPIPKHAIINTYE